MLVSDKVLFSELLNSVLYSANNSFVKSKYFDKSKYLINKALGIESSTGMVIGLRVIASSVRLYSLH